MRLIDAEQLEDKICEMAHLEMGKNEEARRAYAIIYSMTRSEPTVKPGNGEKAEWRAKFIQGTEMEDMAIWCSGCGNEIKGKTTREKIERAKTYKYCPYCGAKMWWGE